MYPSLSTFKPCDLPTLLNSLQPIAPLLDTLADVVFFIKDREARYAFVNQTLARRCGFKHREELLGRTAEMVFPERFGFTPNRIGGCCPAVARWPTNWSCTCITATSRSGA